MPSRVHDVVPFQGRFRSWESFDVARTAHCEQTLTMYVCRNTVHVAVANKRRKLQVPENWVYDRKVYVCTHGYKRVSRSSGSRLRQNVRYTDCKARFTACVVSELSEDGHKALSIKIMGQHVVHSDHPVTLEQWQLYSQNRAVMIEHPHLTHKADCMHRISSNKRAVQEHITTLAGKVCTMKGTHNLHARLKERDKSAHVMDTSRGQSQLNARNPLELDALQCASYSLNSSSDSSTTKLVLQQFVDADVENHVSILSGDDGSNEAVCLASRVMKEHFQVFSELMILDLSVKTERTAHVGQQLQGFMTLDALGNAKPIFLARSLAMSTSLLYRVCQDFKRTHPRWVQTKVLVMNKPLPIAIQVLACEFPAARLLLCQFHVLQLLNEQLAHTQEARYVQVVDFKSGKYVSDQDKLAESLRQLVFSKSEMQYSQVKASLTRQLLAGNGKEQLVMFERDWEPYRALWTSYARTELFDFSSYFTHKMKNFWEPIKCALKRPKEPTRPTTKATNSHEVEIATARTSDSPFSNELPLRPVAYAVHDHTSLLPSNNSQTVSTVTNLRNAAVLERNTNGHSRTADVLRTMQFVESEWASMMLILELSKPIAMDRYDPLLYILINCLSSFAVDLVNSQLSIQSSRGCGPVTVTKIETLRTDPSSCFMSEGLVSRTQSGAEVTVRWFNQTTRETHILQRNASTCDCDFFELYRLPCRHLIWYEVFALQQKQLSLVAVSPRWFLRSYEVPKLSRQRESNEIEYHLL